jgi:plastocyanin
MRWPWWIQAWSRFSAHTQQTTEFFKGHFLRTKTMKKTYLRLCIAAILLVIAIAAGQTRNFSSAFAEEKKPAETVVKIDNFTFTPNVVTVPAGSTIRWINKDDIPHNVVTEDKTIKSKVMDTDEQFSYTFTKPGIYPYFCSIHPKMTGKIVVQ